MADQIVDITPGNEMLEMISNEGFEGMGKAIQILFNTAMQVERERYLGVKAYERAEHRNGYANGFKSKTVKSRMGELNLSIPQVREGGFYPKSLEKGMRSERALKAVLAEMYVQGVSTRKVAAVTEELCGFEVSSADVSRATAELDPILESWRNRTLRKTTYVTLDARYERVRRDGVVVDAAVLIARGVLENGKRSILGVSVSMSEAEVHWRDFMKSLQERGLHGVELFTSDNHGGLRKALKAVFPGVPHQRCQFHLQQNAAAYVPQREIKRQVAADIRAIFNAGNRLEADRLLSLTVAKYREKAGKLAAWLEANIPEGLTVFAFPAQQWSKLRTANGLERVNREVKRRTYIANIFPNEASCLRLVSAILMEISEEWETEEETYMRVS